MLTDLTQRFYELADAVSGRVPPDITPALEPAYRIVTRWERHRRQWRYNIEDRRLFLSPSYNQQMYEEGKLYTGFGHLDEQYRPGQETLREIIANARQRIETIALHFGLEDTDLYAALTPDTAMQLLIIGLRSGDETLVQKLLRYGPGVQPCIDNWRDNFYGDDYFVGALENIVRDVVDCFPTFYGADHYIEAIDDGLSTLPLDDQYWLLHIDDQSKIRNGKTVLHDVRRLMLSNIALPPELDALHRRMIDEFDPTTLNDAVKAEAITKALAKLVCLENVPVSDNPRQEQEDIAHAVHDVICHLYGIVRPSLDFKDKPHNGVAQTMGHVFGQHDGYYGLAFRQSIYPWYQPWTPNVRELFINHCAHEMGHAIEQSIIRFSPGLSNLPVSQRLFRMNGDYISKIMKDWRAAQAETTKPVLGCYGLTGLQEEKAVFLSDVDPEFYFYTPNERHANDFADRFSDLIARLRDQIRPFTASIKETPKSFVSRLAEALKL